MKTTRVLILDGSRETADMLARWAACGNYDAKACKFQGEEPERTYRPTAVSLDLELPNANGWRLLVSLLPTDHSLLVKASTPDHSPGGQ